MRDVNILKLSKKHYGVCIDGEIVYENLNKKSCVRYLRTQKKEHLRQTQEHLSRVCGRSEKGF